MAVKSGDVINFLEQVAPIELAEYWDNPGLQVGSGEKAVKRILVCLDVTSASVEEAISNSVDMIVTHHPLIFKELKRIVYGEGKGSLLFDLIRNGITVYSAHTNLDYAALGVNAHLAEALGLKDAARLGKGPGLAGELDSELGLGDFITRIKKSLDVPFVRVVGKGKKQVKKAAVFCGSFDDDLECVIKSRADVLVTGDLKYHTALDAREAGLCIIDAGHFNTEKIVLPALAAAIKAKFPDVDTDYFKEEEDPFKTC